MLSGTIDSFERLLVQEAGHIVTVCNLLHHLHGQLVVIYGDICGFEDGGKLMLCRSNLIMFGLSRNTKLPELFIEIMHEGRYLGF